MMRSSVAFLLLAIPAAHAVTYASSGGTGTCATDGSSYGYTETVGTSTRTIATNLCPNHPYFVINPNTPYGQSKTFSIPLRPVILTSKLTSTTGQTALTATGGGVGILFSGAYVFSAYGGPQYGTLSKWSNSAPYAEGYTFDACGCHASTSVAVSYHCHVPPSCLLQQLGQTASSHSPQIGWMADGFPLYGPRGKDGALLQSCTLAGKTYGTTNICVDPCNGAGSVNGGSDWVSDGYTYRYYILGAYDDGKQCKAPTTYGTSSALYYPFTPACLRGCGSASGLSGMTACAGATTAGTSSTFSAAAKSKLATNSAACAYSKLYLGSASPSSRTSTSSSKDDSQPEDTVAAPPDSEPVSTNGVAHLAAPLAVMLMLAVGASAAF